MRDCGGVLRVVVMGFTMGLGMRAGRACWAFAIEAIDRVFAIEVCDRDLRASG